jgi:beta-glucosidase
VFNREDSCALSRAGIEQRAQALLDQMTLDEKTALLSGNWDVLGAMVAGRGEAFTPTPVPTKGLERLGIPPILFSDGPRGVVMGRSTCFPVAMARGASFDRDLERRVGEAIGREARAHGANCYGGVCINLLRHPAWGRAQETYGEDPYHVGEMGVNLMLGVQAHNVMACVKHYAANSIENSRFFVNVVVGDRALHEVYLPHFKKIVQAGAASVMGAYNRVNGDHACESRRLLTEILREEWGFEGFTLSDFLYGIRDGEKALRAGMDVEMPLPVRYQRPLADAVRAGRVPESAVDESVLRVLRTQLVFGHTPDPMAYGPELVCATEHIALAREAAEKSMVLIKNAGQVLPFAKHVKRMLVLGRLAVQPNTGDHGSSRVHPPYVITPLEGLKRHLGTGVEIIHYDETQIAAAKAAAPKADCIVIIAGHDFNDEGEFLTPGNPDETAEVLVTGHRNMGRPVRALLIRLLLKLVRNPTRMKDGAPAGGDRQSLLLKAEQRRLIEEVAPLNPNTAVCLVSGSTILIEEWADRAPAILYSWYSGMEGGAALARVLFGDANPGGRLPFTIPANTGQLPHFSSTDPEITYDLYHGYTLVDRAGEKPAFPFGFGLSYTTFAYSDLLAGVRDGALDVRVTVANTGSRDGEEVVQIYVGMEGSRVERPARLLKGFDRVAIPAGTSTEVAIPVPLEELRYYDERERGWRFEPGTYRVMAGPSAADGGLLAVAVELGSL